MFPAFTPYILDAIANNVDPCAVDVVGNTNNPALEYGINATHIGFRLRLNGDPRKNNKPDEIEEHRWGVFIEDQNGNILFAVEVDGKNNVYSVVIRNSSFGVIYSETITLGTNVDVTPDEGIASCNGKPPADPDFLLDFQMPLNKFLINGNQFDFAKAVYKFCFYTTTAAEADVINKENPATADGPNKCGPLINAVGLTLQKLCPIPPAGRNFTVGDTVTITLNVRNNSPTAATGVTVVDLLNVPAGVTISSLTTAPAATSIVPPTGPYTGNVNITTTWTGLTIPANATVPLTITFTILGAPFGTTEITNVDAGIGQLSGTNQFRCTIPVTREVPIIRGVNFSDLEIYS